MSSPNKALVIVNRIPPMLREYTANYIGYIIEEVCAYPQPTTRKSQSFVFKRFEKVRESKFLYHPALLLLRFRLDLPENEK